MSEQQSQQQQPSPVKTPLPLGHVSDPVPRKSITVMEKIMIGLTGFYIVGVLIYGFIPSGPARALAMALYTGIFAYFLFNPLGPKNKKHQSGRL